MAGLTLVPEEQRRLTLDQEIEKALKNSLGEDHPNIKEIREGVKKELVDFLVKQPQFFNDRKSLSVVLSHFVQQQEKLHSKQEPRATLTPAKETSKLKTDCLELIYQLSKQNPELANKLTKILVDYAPKLNSPDPEEKAQALKIIMIMHMLLEDALKTNNTKSLEIFANKTDDELKKLEIDDFAQEMTKKAKDGIKKEANEPAEPTEVGIANLISRGIDRETGRTQVPIAESIGMVITPTVAEAKVSVNPEEALSDRSALPNPFKIKPEPPK